MIRKLALVGFDGMVVVGSTNFVVWFMLGKWRVGKEVGQMGKHCRKEGKKESKGSWCVDKQPNHF